MGRKTPLKINHRNAEKIKAELSNVSWETLQTMSAMESFSFFYQKFKEIIVKYQMESRGKVVNKHISCKQAWMTKELLNKRNDLAKQLNKKNKNYDLIKELRTEYRKSVRKAKSAYYKKLFEDKDPKKTWQAINSLLGKERSQDLFCPIENETGIACKTDVEKAEVFNRLYANIGMHTSENIPHIDREILIPTEKTFSMPTIGPKTVLKCLKTRTMITQ